MIDDILYSGIIRKGEDVEDPAVIAKYSAIADKRPVLMQVPSVISIKRNNEGIKCGLAYDFINVYRRFSESPIEAGYLEIGTSSLMLDADVFYTVKAVAYLSVNKSQKKALACREVFLRIISEIKSQRRLTKGGLYTLVSEWKTDDYYIQELLSGIRIGAYGHSEGQYHYSKRCEMTEYYLPCYQFAMQYVLEHFKTPKEVDAFINEAAKEARADKEFMQGLRKKTSKYIYAMMYKFKDEHPEILREFPPEKGFL